MTICAAQPAVFSSGFVGIGASDVIEIPELEENRASITSPIPLRHKPKVSNPGPKLDNDAGPRTVTL